MLRILFLTDNFPPELNAPASRTYEHCKEWVAGGAKVTVITGFPNFPQGRIYEGYRNRRIRKENMEGIDVIRVWTYITANEGFFRRTADYLSFAASSFFAGLFQKTDIIIATSPQFFTTWSALALSIFKHKPWIFELRDLWPESIKSVGALDDGFIYRSLEKIELFLYRRASHIIPNTLAFKKNLTRRGIPEEKITVIPNGSNLELFSPREPDSGRISALGLRDKFVVGYIGTHGMAHSLDFIVRAIAELDDPGIHFLFIGDGAEKNKVVSLTQELKLENVTFHDPIPKEQMPEYLALVDVSLVPLKKDDTFKTVIPSKIFEAAAMEKPVLLGVDGQAREIVEFYDSGLFFEPENSSDFIEKLRILADHPEVCRRLAAGCRKLANDYDRKTFARQMLRTLEQVAG